MIVSPRATSPTQFLYTKTDEEATEQMLCVCQHYDKYKKQEAD